MKKAESALMFALARACVTIAILTAISLAVAEVPVAQANPYYQEPVYTDVPPPEGTQAPIIIIQTPQNGSFHPKNVTLTFYVIIPKTNGEQQARYGISELYYKGSWDPEITVIAKNIFIDKGFGDNTSYSVDLSDVWGGNLSITVYAVGLGYNLTRQEVVNPYMYNYYDRFEISSYSTVSFVKDLVPPRMSVLSPQNTTYTAPDVKLDFTVNEGVSQVLYSLDNKENQTISGNVTLTGLLNGEHSVTLFVADLAGNAVSSKTLFFNVNSPEPFPLVPVAIGIAISSIACAGLLVYFKRRHPKTGDRSS